MFSAAYGSRVLASFTVTDVTAFTQAVQERAVATRGERRNARGGRSARENSIAGLRWLFSRALGDRIVEDSPALAVAQPSRPRQTRHGLSAEQLWALFAATRSGGNDPALDSLIVRFMVESGARDEGMLGLRLRDLDRDRATVLLREKNDKDGRDQPVSPGLLAALAAFARSRGAARPGEAVFRYQPKKDARVGRPLTGRRLDTLTNRWHTELEFASRLGVTPHSLRHTAIGIVESVAGCAVARQFARHHSNREVTDLRPRSCDCETSAPRSPRTWRRSSMPTLLPGS